MTIENMLEMGYAAFAYLEDGKFKFGFIQALAVKTTLDVRGDDGLGWPQIVVTAKPKQGISDDAILAALNYAAEEAQNTMGAEPGNN